MKPRRPHPLAAIPEAVLELVNRFEYPDVEQLIPASVPGGKGGAPTVVVAASNATELSKSKADYICLGAADQEIVQAAMDELGTSGGRLLLTEGTYEFTFPDSSLACINTVSANPTIEGMGWGNTFINVTGEPVVPEQEVIRIGAFGLAVVRNLAIFAATTTTEIVGIHLAVDDTLVENVWLTGFQGSGGTFGSGVGILATNAYPVISNVIVENSGTGAIIDSASGFRLVQSKFFDNAKPLTVSSSEHGVMSGCVFRSNDEEVLVFDTEFSQFTDSFIVAQGIPADNTFDAFMVDGASDGNLVTGLTLVPNAAGNQWRYGLNINSGNNNAVYANYLGDASEYATADFNDAGTATQTAPGGNGQFSY